MKNGACLDYLGAVSPNQRYPSPTTIVVFTFQTLENFIPAPRRINVRLVAETVLALLTNDELTRCSRVSTNSLRSYKDAVLEIGVRVLTPEKCRHPDGISYP